MNAHTDISLAEMFEGLDLSSKRRTLMIAADALCLCARGNGADDAALKRLVLFLRDPEVALLEDEEAAIVISHLGLWSA